MTFAIKAAVIDPRARTFVFADQKTMYGGKHIATDAIIFVFASENEGGPGLIASGVVTSAKAIAKKHGVARQTPRVSITIRRTALAKQRLGRSELKRFCDWNDDRPRPNSISNSIARQRTKSLASPIKRQHFCADSFRRRISETARKASRGVHNPAGTPWEQGLSLCLLRLRSA